MKVNKADEFYKILEKIHISDVSANRQFTDRQGVPAMRHSARIDRTASTLTISDLFVTS